MTPGSGAADEVTLPVILPTVSGLASESTGAFAVCPAVTLTAVVAAA